MITSRSRQLQERIKNIRYFGFASLGLTGIALGLAQVSSLEYQDFSMPLAALLQADPTGYYVFAGIFGLMSAFCLGSVWQKKNQIMPL